MARNGGRFWPTPHGSAPGPGLASCRVRALASRGADSVRTPCVRARERSATRSSVPTPVRRPPAAAGEEVSSSQPAAAVGERRCPDVKAKALRHSPALVQANHGGLRTHPPRQQSRGGGARLRDCVLLFSRPPTSPLTCRRPNRGWARSSRGDARAWTRLRGGGWT